MMDKKMQSDLNNIRANGGQKIDEMGKMTNDSVKREKKGKTKRVNFVGKGKMYKKLRHVNKK